VKRFTTLVLIFALGLAQPGWAELSSPRPKPRPVATVALDAPVATAQVPASQGLTRSIRPEPRPQSVENAARKPSKGLLSKVFGPPKTNNSRAKPSASGSVCKDPAIRGTPIPTIRGAQKGCGIENPVRVTEVDGVMLSTPATLDCDTARALRKWVSTKLKPAFGRTEVTGLHVAAHYACRSRNNKKGARISEHGRGKAIDISGFRLANGTELSILKHYKSSKGKPIRTAHKGACGIFGTTLGPSSDGYHEDHLHFDTARHRGGRYCK
jgi:hypothetical protein